MKAITILQPWASLIACGAKKIETRGWPTKYRGPIAIHAGSKNMKFDMGLVAGIKARDILGSLDNLPLGRVIAIAELIDCIPMCTDYTDKTKYLDTVSDDEWDFGYFDLDRYAWILANVRPNDPVPAKGKQRIWEWEGCNPAAAKTI